MLKRTELLTCSCAATPCTSRSTSASPSTPGLSCGTNSRSAGKQSKRVLSSAWGLEQAHQSTGGWESPAARLTAQ